jgi:hypothetical protein
MRNRFASDYPTPKAVVRGGSVDDIAPILSCRPLKRTTYSPLLAVPLPFEEARERLCLFIPLTGRALGLKQSVDAKASRVECSA